MLFIFQCKRREQYRFEGAITLTISASCPASNDFVAHIIRLKMMKHRLKITHILGVLLRGLRAGNVYPLDGRLLLRLWFVTTLLCAVVLDF